LLPRLAPKLRRVIAGPMPLEALPKAYESLVGGEVSALKIIIAP
jgi:hypothetical protein